MQKYENTSHKCQFGTKSDPEGDAHLTNISL